MGYEIPQQLQHKERIIFGLTFTQLGWATLFVFLIAVIITRNIGLTPKIVLSAIPLTLGVLFVFFDASAWLTRLMWFMQFRTAKRSSAKMRNLLGIKQVNEGVIQASSKVALLRVDPMNFSLKTPEDQTAITTAFQKFLNSLDFPVQIIVLTKKLDLNEYLCRLEKRTHQKALFQDFASFITGKIGRENMRNKVFYIALPERADLTVQSAVCKERLGAVGLRSEQLKDKELLNVLKDYFQEAPPKALEEASEPLDALISPEVITDKVDCLQVDGQFSRVIVATGYPRAVESGFLDKLISANDDFDISIHIQPYSIESTMVLLNKELQKQRADLYAEEKRNGINPSLEIKYKDTLKVLEALQKGEEKLFNVSLYVRCKATSENDLTLLTKRVESELHSLMIVPKTPILRQLQAYQSTMPLAQDALKEHRNVTTKALSAFFPFTAPFLTVENDGVMLGLNKNGVPYIKNLFGLSNANGIVLSTSGGGKSYFTKLLILRMLLLNVKVMIIDPQAEYLALIQKCNGQIITIAKNSGTTINPLDLMGQDFSEKRLALMDLFKIMFGELTEVQKGILDKALSETYAQAGITTTVYKNKEAPILSDLYKVLETMERKATAQERMTYRAILNRLYLYTEGVFNFMNRRTKIDFHNDLVCFNIGQMPKQVKPVVMFLILEYIYNKMKSVKEQKLLVIDEAWSLLQRAEEASYLFEIVKTCRKYNMGLLLITQDTADLLGSKAGEAVLANTAYSLLLRQKPAFIGRLTQTFNLSQKEKDYLLTATQGRGILILDNDHQELEVIASPEEHNIITTNPADIRKKPKVADNVETQKIQFDLDKGLYEGKSLSLDEKNYLGNHGYKPGIFVAIGKIKQQEFWIKENATESLAHTFVVHSIADWIRPKVDELEISISEKPDIIYKIKNTRYAVEVETGRKKDRKELTLKMMNFDNEYGSRGTIVLVDRNYKYQYETLVKNVKIMARGDVQNLLPGIPVKRSILPGKRRPQKTA